MDTRDILVKLRLFGYGLVVLLRPLSVYPSEMVYWTGKAHNNIWYSVCNTATARSALQDNERLELFSLSFDRQHFVSQYLSLPLIRQGLDYLNSWNSLNYPMLSTSIFYANGSVYDQSAVSGSTFQVQRDIPGYVNPLHEPVTAFI
ncbi:hypothetical protein L208DRAFT_1374374 [Tricholoma matsutake]|nr:hypothetical protein L208DRAFT_1374374 [Tricholoma matsutake 945]